MIGLYSGRLRTEVAGRNGGVYAVAFKVASQGCRSLREDRIAYSRRTRDALADGPFKRRQRRQTIWEKFYFYMLNSWSLLELRG